MARRPACARPRRSDRGLSLIEVLVAVGIFLVVVVGTLGMFGVATAGGFQETSPTALNTGRRAKDLTVATIYLQGLHDYLASLDEAAWAAVLDSWAPGTSARTYCAGPGRSPCAGGEPVPPGALGAYPLPPPAAAQLPWTALRLTVRRWTWDCDARRFSPAPLRPAADRLIGVHSTIYWRSKEGLRTLVPSGGGVERYIAPDHSTIPQDPCP
jgi:prepilin-type N-terminal cleavage/methylation domain-containing protein